jgi:hypothetical protein
VDDFDLGLDLGFTLDFDLGVDLGFAFDLGFGFGFEAWRAVFFGRPAFTPLSLIGPAVPVGTIK